MMTRMKKTRKTRTGTKNRRSSENPTNSAAHSCLRQARVGLRFRAAGLVWAVLTGQIEPIASMRVWIGSGKEDWRRPLPRPNIITLPNAITSAGFCFNGVFSLAVRRVRVDRLRFGPRLVAADEKM